ncbi:MAG: hypothetical protein AAFQ09_10685 [Pseudomonadota bacterium]
MRFLGLDHPTFKPRWVRVAVVIFCTVWATFELTLGDPRWGIGIGALAAICAYKFVVTNYEAIETSNHRKDGS